jgi:hypothetical protein
LREEQDVSPAVGPQPSVQMGEHLTVSIVHRSTVVGMSTSRRRSRAVPARIAVGLGSLRLLAGRAAVLRKCGGGSGADVALELTGSPGSRDTEHSRQEASGQLATSRNVRRGGDTAERHGTVALGAGRSPLRSWQKCRVVFSFHENPADCRGRQVTHSARTTVPALCQTPGLIKLIRGTDRLAPVIETRGESGTR